MNESALPPLVIGSHRAPVLPDVLQEHLEEVAFLSIQRRRLLFSPELSLLELGDHDERISAHWEGLVLGGPASVHLALERMEAFDPWESAAALRVWMELGEPTREEITSAQDAAEEEVVPSWREALRQIPGARLQELFPPADPLPDSPRLQGVLAYAWGWHQILPDSLASKLAFSSDPDVRWSVARSLGWREFSRDGPQLLSALLTDPEEDVHRAALWSGTLLDPAKALVVARERLSSEPSDPFAARVLGLLGEASDGERLKQLARHEDAGPACVLALGELGDLAAMDLLLELVGGEDEALAQAAKGAMEALLGEVPAPLETPEAPAPSELEGIREAWEEMSPSFQDRGGIRWLRGRPFPWEGPPSEEPMESLWRRSLLVSGSENLWLRREVPDGFFSGLPSLEAVPGA